MTILGFHVTSSKLENKELSILLRFWFSWLLEQLKTYLFTNFQFDRAFRLVIMSKVESLGFCVTRVKIAAGNAVTWIKKSDFSPEISQSEQSMYENKYSYRYL